MRATLFLRTLTLLILALNMLSLAAIAQENERQVAQKADSIKEEAIIKLTPDVASKLAIKIEMAPGEMTVEAFAAVLSKQTGLTIRVAPALSERKIIVQIADATAADLLGAMADMNDWTVREIKEKPTTTKKGQGTGKPDKNVETEATKTTSKSNVGGTAQETETVSLLILHRILQVPQEPNFIPRLIQNALPRDLQEYLKVARPSDNHREYRNPADAFRVSNDLKTFRADANDRWRITIMDSQALKDFRATLSIDSLIKEQLPYNKLTEAQKCLLLQYYIFKSLHSVDV